MATLQQWIDNIKQIYMLDIHFLRTVLFFLTFNNCIWVICHMFKSLWWLLIFHHICIHSGQLVVFGQLCTLVVYLFMNSFIWSNFMVDWPANTLYLWTLHEIDEQYFTIGQMLFIFVPWLKKREFGDRWELNHHNCTAAFFVEEIQLNFDQ